MSSYQLGHQTIFTEARETLWSEKTVAAIANKHKVELHVSELEKLRGLVEQSQASKSISASEHKIAHTWAHKKVEPNMTSSSYGESGSSAEDTKFGFLDIAKSTGSDTSL